MQFISAKRAPFCQEVFEPRTWNIELFDWLFDFYFVNCLSSSLLSGTFITGRSLYKFG
jgi:hypothetical protein